MTKIITITGNNHITGIEYGVVEMPDTPVRTGRPNTNKQKIANKRYYMKRLQNTRIKQK